MKAMNGVGYGPYSDVVSIVSDRTPLQMLPPTSGTVTCKSIELNWLSVTDYE